MSVHITKKFLHLKKYAIVRQKFVLEGLCRRHLSWGCLMLDAGCSSNGCSLTHVPEGVSIIGLDFSRRNVLKSKGKTRTKNFGFVVASLTDLPFKNGIFDFVICIDVLEHINAKQHVLSELSYVTRKGGGLVGSTSNLLNPTMLLDSVGPAHLTQKIVEKIDRTFSGQQYERHGVRLTPSKLVRTLYRAGYERTHLCLLGNPPFRWQLYESSDKKLPWYAYLWVAFNKVTDNGPLFMLKEIMMFEAIK